MIVHAHDGIPVDDALDAGLGDAAVAVAGDAVEDAVEAAGVAGAGLAAATRIENLNELPTG